MRKETGRCSPLVGRLHGTPGRPMRLGAVPLRATRQRGSAVEHEDPWDFSFVTPHLWHLHRGHKLVESLSMAWPRGHADDGGACQLIDALDFR
mmetsp:Transcript_136057/g.235095  ORF Transcript_136057/g.235095 Transcript_136057/m.235095 type:complete len:93 (-) Transcript_136057:53-331(-)